MGLAISTLTPSVLSDSAALYSDGTKLISSPFARLVIQTTATTLVLSTYSDMKSAFSAISKYGVYVDGVFLTSFNPSANGAADIYIGLDAGLKTVEFVAGPNTVYMGPLLGNYLVSVTANKAMDQITTEANDRLLVYGDSIAVGDGCGTAVQQSAWPMQLRAEFDGDVALEATGARALYHDASTPELRASFVAKIVARNPTKFWSAIGTNDYGLSLWTAADFGTAYAALLDALHAALPSMTIYAQTPIVRTSSGANGLGSTLADYRTQITTVCSTRAWALLQDGTAYMTTSDLADGLHPNVTGHGKYKTAVALVV